MTQKEWELASDEERSAEMERCKDEAYFYNTYWRKEGMPEYSKEEFDRMRRAAINKRFATRNPEQWIHRTYAVLPEFCYPKSK